jgi:hypothetical protein
LGEFDMSDQEGGMIDIELSEQLLNAVCLLTAVLIKGKDPKKYIDDYNKIRNFVTGLGQD